MLNLTYEKIMVSSIFALQSIAYLKILTKANEHSTLYLKGTIEPAMGIAVLKEKIYGEKIQVFALAEDADPSPIYTGIIQSAAITEKNGLYQIELSALSGTCLLDEKLQSRSFQDVQMMYRDLVETILLPVPHAKAFFHRGLWQQIARPLIQYKETDWAFIKRLASHFQTALVPDAISGNPAFWFGMRTSAERVVFSEEDYAFQIDAKFYELGGEKAGYRRRDFCYYLIEDRNNHQIGDQTIFQQKELVIVEKLVEFKNNELLYTYKLGRESLIDERIHFNALFTGLTLGGVVTNTDKEHVYLRLDIDFARGTVLYPYRWAPASGNLMYCMPEKGARVVLYCKSSDERGAVATNGREVLGTFLHVVSDYNKRSLTTAKKKNMYLHPDGMGFIGTSQTDVPLHIQMYDAGGIAFESHRRLELLAQAAVRLEAPNVVFHSPLAMQFLRTPAHSAEHRLNIVPVGTGFWNHAENTTPLAKLKQTLKNYRDADLNFMQEAATYFNNSSDDAIDVIFNYNETIVLASSSAGIEKELIQAILFRELIFYNALDSTDIIRVKMGIHRSASIGLGQIFPETAIAAEMAYTGGAVVYSQEEMFKRLQDNDTNIYYVALVLLHKAQGLGIEIGGANPPTENVRKTFSAYNGFGDAAKKYGNETFYYYRAFKAYSKQMDGVRV